MRAEIVGSGSTSQTRQRTKKTVGSRLDGFHENLRANRLATAASQLIERFRAFPVREDGQALPLAALMLTMVIGMCGTVLDVGRVVAMHDRLQAATDAAALAGATALPRTSASTTATQYSAVAGNQNASTMLAGATMVSGYPLLTCLNTLTRQGLPCQAPANANAIVVKQQITVKLLFLQVLGVRTLTLNATSTASMRGSAATPYNIAIILDATLSMQAYDTNCNMTQMACALNGIQSFLQALSPCKSDYTTCSVTAGVAKDPVHQVALFTFPNITVGTANTNTNCTNAITASGARTYGYPYDSSLGYYSMYPETAWTGIATSTAYSFPSATAASYQPGSTSTNPTYQVTNFLSDYKTSDTATTLNGSSDLVQAANAISSCSGLLTPNYAGEYGTYYAGALYAAQSALTAQQAAYPTSQNVIILLSDGDANAPQTNSYTSGRNSYAFYVMPPPATASGVYPSYKNQCAQGVTAAGNATTAGTRVYTVAYGAPTSTSSCKTDSSNITGCSAMSTMASETQYFYSDYNQSGGSSGGFCYSSQAVTALSQIFTQIAGDLTAARLIPNGTT